MPWERFSIGMVWMPDGVAPVGSKVKHGGGGHHKAVTETSQAKARECISAMDFPQRIFTLGVPGKRKARKNKWLEEFFHRESRWREEVSERALADRYHEQCGEPCAITQSLA